MSRSKDFLLTAEELRLRRQKRRRLLIAGASLLLLLLLLILLGRPASHVIKRWQARRHAEKAFALIDQENWNEAQKEATAAYQLAPNEPQATRAVARFLSRVRQPQALEFWDRLAKEQPLTRDDLRDEAMLALAIGETGRASNAMKSLLQEHGRDATPRDWLLAAQLAAERGAPNESVAALQHVFQNPAASTRERLQAAILELRATGQNQKDQADAWSRIEKLAAGKDAAGLDALVLLAQRELSPKAETLKTETLTSEGGSQRSEDRGQRTESGTQRTEDKTETLKTEMLNGASGVSDIDGKAARVAEASGGKRIKSEDRGQRTEDGIQQNAEELKTADSAIRIPHSAFAAANNKEPITASIADALDAHPLAKAPQQLLAVDLRIHASPNEKAKLIQSAIDRWKDADSKSLVALATWLNGKGEFQRELDTIPLERAVQERDLFLQRLDAFGALGRWDKIKQALSSESFPLDPMIAHMYLARCNAQLGEKIAADNNWQRALEAAGGDASKLLTLADYAEKNGATTIAAKAYGAAIETAPKLRAAWQGQLRLAQASRDTKTIHAVLADMLRIWPNDTAIQNDEGYLRLLLLSEQKPEVESRKAKVENEQQTRNAERGMRNEGAEKKSGNGSQRTEDREQKQEQNAEKVKRPLTNNREPITASAQPTSELITVEQIAQQLVQRDPTSLPHRTLLALVYLKENRPATALGVYENLHVPPNALTPSALAVHAAVLEANGNTADAAKEASQISRSALLPEENALLGSL